MTCLVIPQNVIPTMKSIKTGSEGNGVSSEASEEAAPAVNVNDPKMPLFDSKAPDYDHLNLRTWSILRPSASPISAL